MKKILFVLITVLICVLMVFACSNSGKGGAQTSTAEQTGGESLDESRIKELVEMAFSVTGMWLDNSTYRDFSAP